MAVRSMTIEEFRNKDIYFNKIEGHYQWVKPKYIVFWGTDIIYGFVVGKEGKRDNPIVSDDKLNPVVKKISDSLKEVFVKSQEANNSVKELNDESK